MVDSDGAERDAALLAGVEGDEVEGVEDGEREEEIPGGLSEDSHGWALRRDIVKHFGDGA